MQPPAAPRKAQLPRVDPRSGLNVLSLQRIDILRPLNDLDLQNRIVHWAGHVIKYNHKNTVNGQKRLFILGPDFIFHCRPDGSRRRTIALRDVNALLVHKDRLCFRTRFRYDLVVQPVFDRAGPGLQYGLLDTITSSIATATAKLLHRPLTATNTPFSTTDNPPTLYLKCPAAAKPAMPPNPDTVSRFWQPETLPPPLNPNAFPPHTPYPASGGPMGSPGYLQTPPPNPHGQYGSPAASPAGGAAGSPRTLTDSLTKHGAGSRAALEQAYNAAGDDVALRIAIALEIKRVATAAAAEAAERESRASAERVEAAAAHRALKADLDAEQRRVATAEAAKDALKQTVESLLLRADEAIGGISGLKENVSDGDAKLAALRQQLSDVKDQIAKDTVQLGDTLAAAEAVQGVLGRTEQQLAEAASARSDSARSVGQVAELLRQARATLSERCAELDSVTAALSQAVARERDAAAAAAAATAAASAAESARPATLAAAEAARAQAERRAHSLQQQLDTANAALEKERRIADDVRSRINRAKDGIAMEEREEDVLRTAAEQIINDDIKGGEAHEKQMARLQKELAAVEAEVEAAKKQLATQSAALRARIEKAEVCADSVTAERQRIVGRRDEALAIAATAAAEEAESARETALSTARSNADMERRMEALAAGIALLAEAVDARGGSASGSWRSGREGGLRGSLRGGVDARLRGSRSGRARFEDEVGSVDGGGRGGDHDGDASPYSATSDSRRGAAARDAAAPLPSHLSPTRTPPAGRGARFGGGDAAATGGSPTRASRGMSVRSTPAGPTTASHPPSFGGSAGGGAVRSMRGGANPPRGQTLYGRRPSATSKAEERGGGGGGEKARGGRAESVEKTAQLEARCHRVRWGSGCECECDSACFTRGGGWGGRDRFRGSALHFAYLCGPLLATVWGGLVRIRSPFSLPFVPRQLISLLEESVREGEGAAP